MRWSTTYVLAAWDVSGELVKTWEPRQALRARWGGISADKAIFSAACEAENRYSEAKVGKRLASSRSPSVGLIEETTRRFREQSPPASKSPCSNRSQSSTPATMPSKPRASAAAVADLAQLLEELRMDYCECAGVNNFNGLDSKGKAEFLQAWKQ
jgi:hypothetical protein